MGAVMESVFCIVYLLTGLFLGVVMLRRGKRLFGTLTIILAAGDSFHLVPRIYGNLTGTLSGLTNALSLGTLVTSISMTVFYVLLYHFFCKRFGKETKTPLTITVYILAIIRIALCLFPQNLWFSGGSITWGIIRNIPFLILGLLIVFILFNWAKADQHFKFAWLAVLLSFAFYVPVVLFADTYPITGMLMLPKTVCYVWIIVMGYRTKD